jgi:hypothetical protein
MAVPAINVATPAAASIEQYLAFIVSTSKRVTPSAHLKPDGCKRQWVKDKSRDRPRSLTHINGWPAFCERALI